MYCVLSSAVEQVDANKRERERGKNKMGNLHIEFMTNIQPVRNRMNRIKKKFEVYFMTCNVFLVYKLQLKCLCSWLECVFVWP